MIFQSLAFLPRSYKPGVWVTAGKSSQIRCLCCFRGRGVFTTVQQSLYAGGNTVILPLQEEISTSSVLTCQSALPSVLLHTVPVMLYSKAASFELFCKCASFFLGLRQLKLFSCCTLLDLSSHTSNAAWQHRLFGRIHGINRSLPAVHVNLCIQSSQRSGEPSPVLVRRLTSACSLLWTSLAAYKEKTYLF